jgi:DNA modification methylase
MSIELDQIYVEDCLLTSPPYFNTMARMPVKTQEGRFLAPVILTESSCAGDVVYDPFMGSGTTAKMAKLNGRNFIGSEISQEYADTANERLSKMGATL